MSEWREITTAPNDGRFWQVSDAGSVTRDFLELRQSTTDRGYKRVSMGGKSIAIHRLVALAFAPNPDGRPEINHKNGVKDDNRALNLEWCTRSENMRHAYAIGLHPGVRLAGKDSPNYERNGARHPQSKPVRAIFLDGTTKDYESARLAEKDGFRSSHISLCLNGHRKSHGGAKWMPLPAPPALSQSKD